MNCLDCIMEFAIFFLTTNVCSLLSITSFSVRFNTSSTFESFFSNPNEFNLSSSCFFSSSDCGFLCAIRVFALLRNFLRNESIFQISYFLLNPYCFRSSFSASILSFCHGCPGVENFFLCFFGSPIFYLVKIWWLKNFLNFCCPILSLARRFGGVLSLDSHHFSLIPSEI